MNTSTLTIGASIALLTAPIITRAHAITNDFAVGSAGWRAVDVDINTSFAAVVGDPYPVIYSPTGGNPGGYVHATDRNSLLWFFDAPAIWLGDQSVHYGDTLSFDITRSSGSPHDEHPDVVLVGGGYTFVIDAGPSPSVGEQWTTFDVPLHETALWHVGTLGGPVPTGLQFRTALSDVTALRIRGDFTDALDRSGLDNVTISESCPISTIRVAEVEVCWPSKLGRHYQVDYRSDLSTNMWVPLYTNVFGDGMILCVPDRVTQPQRFYRVVCTPSPMVP